MNLEPLQNINLRQASNNIPPPEKKRKSSVNQKENAHIKRQRTSEIGKRVLKKDSLKESDSTNNQKN